MHDFIKHFVREGHGVWICVEPAEFQLPQGRIQIAAGTRFTLGASFMGIEVAEALEEQYERINRF
jgi:hypothetical protein